MWFNMFWANTRVIPVSAVGKLASQRGRLASIWNGIILCERDTETSHNAFHTAAYLREFYLLGSPVWDPEGWRKPHCIVGLWVRDMRSLSNVCVCPMAVETLMEENLQGKGECWECLNDRSIKTRWQNSILFIHHAAPWQHMINIQTCQPQRGSLR